MVKVVSTARWISGSKTGYYRKKILKSHNARCRHGSGFSSEANAVIQRIGSIVLVRESVFVDIQLSELKSTGSIRSHKELSVQWWFQHTKIRNERHNTPQLTGKRTILLQSMQLKYPQHNQGLASLNANKHTCFWRSKLINKWTLVQLSKSKLHKSGANVLQVSFPLNHVKRQSVPEKQF